MRLFFAFLFLIVVNVTRAQSKRLHVLQIKNTTALRDYFKYDQKDEPIVSGHRGGTTKGYPENCIATFENTLSHTPAFFEIDPRLTKDSVIVLMHDATLDRTTTGTGKVSDYTWEELKKFRLKDADGKVTEYGIPLLEDVIKWSRGKTVINLDKKDVPLAMTAALIKRNHAEAHVMLTVHNAKEAKFYTDFDKNLTFSAFVLTQKALEEYEAAGIPWSHMIAYIGPKFTPENKELLNMLHDRGVKCMISAAPTYDKLTDSLARSKAYVEIIRSGADIIESDLPIEVADALRSTLAKKP
jgi:glycerophosphoryl diester phosphodiesterase